MRAGEPATPGAAARAPMALQADFDERPWRGVPGPFYTGHNDPSATGLALAPNHVLQDLEQREWVFRQPATTDELTQLVDAAESEPAAAYGADGSAHWTLAALREYWARREEHVAALEADLKARPACVKRVRFIQSLRAARWFLEGDLVEYLAWYGYCLEHGRAPSVTDKLPSIA